MTARKPVPLFGDLRKRNAQDKVRDGYIARFSLTQTEADSLHLFFSPHRIPKGLTLEEVRIALTLYPVRDARRSKRFTLPEEFWRGGRITRTEFRDGIWKLLQAISAD